MAVAEGGGPVPMGPSSPYREESRLRASPARTTLSFVVPALPKRVIARPRLVDRLDAVLDASLTSLWGPAGAGKSIAAAQWCLERCPVPVAWVTIEDVDADHLVARLLAAVGSINGVEPRKVDSEPGPENRADALAHLAAACAGSVECVIVVDQARTRAQTPVMADVVRALRGCPVSVLRLGRLPLHPALAPMLLQGTVAQLDPVDLVLDVDDVASVVKAYSSRPVDYPAAAELTERLGGWMAGAVFAGMTRATGNSNPDAMIAAAWPAISSYVTAEMVEPLPEPLRGFLGETACVGELSAPLAELLTGRPDSHQLLESVRDSGLPFAHGTSGFESIRLLGVLRTVLDEQAINLGPEGRTHRLRQAIDWYRDRDMPVELAECSFRLGDWDGVVETAITHLRSILDGQQFRQVAMLAARTPNRVLADDGLRVVAVAALLLWDGRIAAMHDLLGAFQRVFDPDSLALADLLRSGVSSWVDDPSAALTAAESAVVALEALGPERSRDDDEPMQPLGMAELARASALLAGAYGGQWERARPHFVELPEDLHSTLAQIHHLRLRGARATFLALSGEADSAVREARSAEVIAADLGHESHRMAADAYWALGESLRLRADFEPVDAFVSHVLELSARNGRRNLAAAALSTRAHALVDMARPDEAVELLAAHRPRDYGLPHTIAAMLAAAEARAVCAVGAPHRALDVLRAAPATSMTATAMVTASLGIGDLAEARRLVDKWPADGTVASDVRRHLATAAMHDASGATRNAHACLRSALARAAGHGLVQPFLESGATVRRLLGRVEVREQDAAMLSLVQVVRGHLEVMQPNAPRFTSREATVMMLLERRMSLPAIAKEMFVSVNTIKFHVKAIYRKLGVTSRDEAIAAWQTASGVPREA